MNNTTKFNHLMLDLETMGSKSNSAIVSIGAVEFDIETGKTGEEFYKVISLQSAIDLGLEMDASTVIWWMQQSDEARKDLCVPNRHHIAEVLNDFKWFCKDKDYHVWGNSARFDCGILQNAYSKLNQPVPWDFRKERDVRTLVSFAPSLKKTIPVPGTKHNALDDCYYQIEYCAVIYNFLSPELTI